MNLNLAQSSKLCTKRDPAVQCKIIWLEGAEREQRRWKEKLNGRGREDWADTLLLAGKHTVNSQSTPVFFQSSTSPAALVCGLRPPSPFCLHRSQFLGHCKHITVCHSPGKFTANYGIPPGETQGHTFTKEHTHCFESFKYLNIGMLKSDRSNLLVYCWLALHCCSVILDRKGLQSPSCSY